MAMSDTNGTTVTPLNGSLAKHLLSTADYLKLKEKQKIMSSRYDSDLICSFSGHLSACNADADRATHQEGKTNLKI